MEGGVSATFEPSSWPFGATAAYYLCYVRGLDYEDTEEEFRARTHELEFGPSKPWVIGNWGRPYAAGGVAIGKATASLESASVTDSDSGVGGWVGGGFTFVLARHLDLGLNSRYSYIPVHIAGVHTNAGGARFGGTINYEW